MNGSVDNRAGARAPYDATLFRRAAYDAHGVFVGGRSLEARLLREAGRRDPSLGRIFEGHLNGALLVALYGTDAQRARADADVTRGMTFAVWNTQGSDPVKLTPHPEGGGTLSGAKTWASGAGSIERPIVTAALPDGRIQICLVPLDRQAGVVDRSSWKPLGMHASDSFAIAFDRIRLHADDLIGEPDLYGRAPWFLGGALRFAAVHAGVIERLFDETARFLVERRRDADPFQQARLGTMKILAQSALHWIEAGTVAWDAFDNDPSPANVDLVVDTADMARLAVERAALEAIELCVRTVGAHGLVEPLPFAGLVRDLTMYLRQPAPDAALVRVASSALRAASARRSAAVANSTA